MEAVTNQIPCFSLFLNLHRSDIIQSFEPSVSLVLHLDSSWVQTGRDVMATLLPNASFPTLGSDVREKRTCTISAASANIFFLDWSLVKLYTLKRAMAYSVPEITYGQEAMQIDQETSVFETYILCLSVAWCFHLFSTQSHRKHAT